MRIWTLQYAPDRVAADYALLYDSATGIWLCDSHALGKAFLRLLLRAAEELLVRTAGEVRPRLDRKPN